MAARGKNQGNGKYKHAYAPKPKILLPPKREDPAKDSISHKCGETGHWKRNCPQYLAELLKKKKNAASGAGGSGSKGNAISRDGIFQIDLCNSYANESSIYTISNKRAKLDLDSALLWHCRLGHISKKCIEKLQHDGLLNSTDLRAFEKYVPCMSGNIARKPYTHQVEMVKDLLGLIHTDHKHEVFETFKVFQKEVENQLGKTIKSLRSDRGCEYISQEFLDHLKDHGIIAHRTPPYTPQHNGVSERRNRTLLDMVRSMMSETTLPKSFWDYALETAGRILNMVPTKKVEKTPYEVYEVYLHRILKGNDGLFFLLPTREQSPYLEITQEEDTHPSIDTSLNNEEDDLEIDEPQSDIIPIRRSTRTRRPTDRMCLYIDAEEHELSDLGEPANYKVALLDLESDKWLNAMNVEMQSMKNNEVWDLVELPCNCKTVDSKWLFKKKTDMDGVVHTYKARLVAKGYTQTPRIDYEETFSPVVNIRAIMILIAITAFYDYEIWQMDVKTAFLNKYLSEEVYMEQPEGFVNPKYPNRKFGFTQNRDEPCVYLKASGSNVTFLILYVDDILIMGNNIPMLQDVKSYLGRCFAMKDLGYIMYVVRCTRPDVCVPLQTSMPFQQNPVIFTGLTPGFLATLIWIRMDADDLKFQTGYVFVLNGGAADWKSAKIVLSIEDKLNYLEQPLLPVPVAPEGQQVAPEIIAAHTAWIKGSKEIVVLMLMTMEPEIQRNYENLHAYEMLQDLKTLFAQQAEQELFQTTRDFHSSRTKSRRRLSASS
ncbi:retrotransposon protein, putative, ty1-copia subclass [Tanacetum coccineum]